MKYVVIFFTVFFLLGIPLSANAQRGPQGPTPVIVSEVKLSSFSDKIEALGTARANETVVITADTSEKIVEINFEDGQEVKQGDLLVTLDKKQEDAELRAAQAELKEAESALERAQSLQGSQALSQATLVERKAEVARAQATVETIKARLAELEITAPFDGILGLREVSVGTLVQPGDRITSIDDLSQIKIDFDIPSVFLATLTPGLPILGKVEAYGDKEFQGEIRTVNTQIDPVTRTVRVRAVLPNEEMLLKPGLLMTIMVFKNERETLLIPEEALVKRGRKNFVYVVDDNGEKTIVRQTEITIGGRQPGYVEVLSGLNAGDEIVSHGTVKIRDGAEVNIRGRETGDAPLQKLLEQEEEN